MKPSKRLKQTKPIIAPRVMKLLQDRLDSLNMNPHELANQMDAAYDHIRLIVKGEKFAGKLMIREIGRRLNVNEDTLMTAYREDKAEKAGHKIPPMEPRLAELIFIFNKMPDEGKNRLVRYAKFDSGDDIRAVQ